MKIPPCQQVPRRQVRFDYKAVRGGRTEFSMALPSNLNGILCIHKPQDFTSFDVVKKLRGMTKIKKIGHAGTLDPMATGVLPVFLGAATKACDILPDQNKRYTAAFQLGLTSNTQDIWGEILSRRESRATERDILDLLPRFRGDIEQIPPMFSAIQINGQRLYDLARKGVEVERKPRSVHIYRFELLSFDGESQSGVLDIGCSKGTYIRTLIHDLGEALGIGGVMTSLTRTEAAGFSLQDCLTFQEVEELLRIDSLTKRVLPVEQVFQSYPAIRLNPVQSGKFLNGVRLDLNRVHYPQGAVTCRVYDAQNNFLGLADCNTGTMELVLKKFFIERK